MSMNIDANIQSLLKELKTTKLESAEKDIENSDKNSKREYRGRAIWTCDAETDPFRRGRVPKPFIWGLYTGTEYYQFLTTKELIEFISEHDVIVYAHNGGKFDWHFVTEYIDDFEPLTIISGRLAKFRIGNAEFRDSYNIIPAPLSAYKKDEISYDIFEEGEREKPENWKLITDYLKSDCVYLHEMITQFIADYGMNLTQAGAAMKTWAKMAKVKKPKSTEFYYAEMSKYYFGGRVECFKKGIINKRFKVVDIKSAYPFAMSFDHPWGMNYDTFDYLPDLGDDDLGRCFITLETTSHGAFPLREKMGLVFYSDGLRREFHVSGWEYIAARDTGTLGNCNVKIVRQYHDKINFQEYVTFFFAMKAEADEMLKIYSPSHEQYSYWAARRLFAKLFLNSLYGKFASNPENYQEFMTLPANMVEASCKSDGWFYCNMLSDSTAIVNRPLGEEDRRYYDVAVAASITGFVRAYLWRNICAAKGVLYCDTDCIVAEDVSNVKIGDALGDWELEAECDSAAIAGKKLYAFRKESGGYKTASKGVRLSAQEIIKIAEGKAITYEPEAPTFSVKRGKIFTPRKIQMI